MNDSIDQMLPSRSPSSKLNLSVKPIRILSLEQLSRDLPSHDVPQCFFASILTKELLFIHTKALVKMSLNGEPFYVHTLFGKQKIEISHEQDLSTKSLISTENTGKSISQTDMMQISRSMMTGNISQENFVERKNNFLMAKNVNKLDSIGSWKDKYNPHLRISSCENVLLPSQKIRLGLSGIISGDSPQKFPKLR